MRIHNDTSLSSETMVLQHRVFLGLVQIDIPQAVLYEL